MTPQQPTDPNSPKSTPTQDQPPAVGAGPGASTVNALGISLISAYVVLLTLFSVYLLIKVWPHCTGVPIPPFTQTTQTGNSNRPPPQTTRTGNSNSPPGQTSQDASRSGQTGGGEGAPTEPRPQSTSSEMTAASEPQCKNPTLIEFFWRSEGYWVWEEVRLLLIVITAGVLGALLHVIRSLFWYVGHRDLRSSWVLMYILLPLAGALLAIAFYFLIRGGFFPQAKADQSNPIGFAALAFLMGLFTAQAGEKLKQVFETIFSPAPQGANPRPPVPGAPPAAVPKVAAVSPAKGATGEVNRS